MTFNPNSDISGNRVGRGGGGRTAGLALGGGGLGVLAIFLISQFTGVDLSGFLGGGAAPNQATVAQTQQLEECRTGQDANENVECRMAGAYVSIDDYWARTLPALSDAHYASPGFQIFEGNVSTACGAATSATGPFYCPGDSTIYIDTDFFGTLRSQFGASGGPLSELYIVAHEWGHHIQNSDGTFAQADRRGSGAGSDSVRVELQADCYAGAWVGAAATTRDGRGETFLLPPTREQIADALDAAATVGDDRIQQQSSGRVDPEGWTHGSSEQRQRWFLEGYRGGPATCDTFSAARL